MSYRILKCCDISSLNVVSGLPVFSASETIDSDSGEWYLSWTLNTRQKNWIQFFQFLPLNLSFIAANFTLHCSAHHVEPPQKRKGWLAAFRELDEHACGICNTIPHCVIYTPYNLIFSRRHRWLSINETGN